MVFDRLTNDQFFWSCHVEPEPLIRIKKDFQRDISELLNAEMSRLFLRKMKEPEVSRLDMTRLKVIRNDSIVPI